MINILYISYRKKVLDKYSASNSDDGGDYMYIQKNVGYQAFGK